MNVAALFVAAAFFFSSCSEKPGPVVNGGDGVEDVTPVLRLAPAHDTIFEACGIGFVMRYVPSGTFAMGAGDDDPVASDDEKPSHHVTLDAFLLAECEVNQFLYHSVMGENPSRPLGMELPVNMVGYVAVQRFIDSLSSITGFRFRLPTEAEWEYAAKDAGLHNPATRYAGSDNADSVAWHSGNSGGILHPCGVLSSNLLGFYDLSGNVREWCSDWYGTYSSQPQTNPQGPPMPEHFNMRRHLVRGGSYRQDTNSHRVTARQYLLPDEASVDLGFRLAISVGPVNGER